MAATDSDTQPSGATPGGIVEFLLARIAEDEREANACLAQWARGDGGTPRRWYRVEAECRAKRAIIEMWAARQEDHLVVQAHATGLGLAIKALAAVYADHPDYQPAWRP